MAPYTLKPHPEDPSTLQVWDGTQWHPVPNATSRHIRSTYDVFQGLQKNVYEATITVDTLDTEKNASLTPLYQDVRYQDAAEADADVNLAPFVLVPDSAGVLHVPAGTCIIDAADIPADPT